MKTGYSIAGAILALALMMVTQPAQACNDGGNCAYAPGHNKVEIRGAPGPIAGAGLPILAIGYGVYCLIRRRRKHN